MLDNTQSHSYIASLDGLRAFAVLAVVAYHFSFSWAAGGFLGVDIFFVISGYLITSNILTSQERNHNFNLREFWIKRIRRLLPAVYVMIIIIFVWTSLLHPEIVNTLKGDAASSLVYISNWWFIFHKLSYFDSFGSPSPLKNLWSLAIEEQFYIVWPIVLLAGKKIFKKRSKLTGFVFIITICSAMLMALMYKPGEDPSRVYYGTDTRAFELLIGGLLAIIWPINKVSSKKTTIKLRNTINIASIITLTVFILSVIFTNEYKTFLYRGGMLLISIDAAILIACISHPSCYLGRLLSRKPLSWLGKRSYGIYLWHYPIIILSTPVYELGNPVYWRVIIQLAIIFIIAELSYSFIEMPIRKYGFKNILMKYLSINIFKFEKPVLARRISVIIILPLVLALFTSCIKSIQKDKVQAGKSESSTMKMAINNSKQTSEIEDSKTSSADNPTTSSTDNSKTSSIDESKASSMSKDKTYNKMLAIGDSIMLDIAADLNKNHTNLTIDAKVGRQLNQAVELAPAYAAFNNADNAVIIELGTNGYFTDKQIDTLLNSFSKAHIYLINTRVPRPWEKVVNDALNKKSKENNNITLIDWYSLAINHPDYFSSDCVHLKANGVQALVSLIDQVIISGK
ncbi:acyltransferase family protein [Candidatus Clostridium stratigraminis]|uniref:Acyltransferase family protein n=1 Tax=Candidatus Clostridium stratigraminis TaxID=3381661 RepID=A0ABW8T7K4_9CLOT